MDRFYFVFPFLFKYSQTRSLYYEISDIPILKYVQVNGFGSFRHFYNDRVSLIYTGDGRRHDCSR